VEGDDLSLFYGDEAKLTTISDRHKFLPSDFYGSLVRDCVVCCCDIVLVRNNPQTGRKETLLVERATDPVKGVWWWPGGRILKGETFFAAASRKAQQETGISHVQPIQVLGIYNTFFPTSHWDNESSKGTQTVNAVVLVEIITTQQQEEAAATEVKLDNTSEQYKWISLDPQSAIQNKEDPYVWKNLQRLKAWNPTYDS
jgi:ADP-ribose pyrophosphatase YjhB (NUDIX family)